jgi:hypothetical protein
VAVTILECMASSSVGIFLIGCSLLALWVIRLALLGWLSAPPKPPKPPKQSRPRVGWATRVSTWWKQRLYRRRIRRSE